MKTSVIDIGGTNVKLLATGRKEPVNIPSGPSGWARQRKTRVPGRARRLECDVGVHLEVRPRAQTNLPVCTVDDSSCWSPELD